MLQLPDLTIGSATAMLFIEFLSRILYEKDNI